MITKLLYGIWSGHTELSEKLKVKRILIDTKEPATNIVYDRYCWSSHKHIWCNSIGYILTYVCYGQLDNADKESRDSTEQPSKVVVSVINVGLAVCIPTVLELYMLCGRIEN